jgi:hypothetical protein
LKYHWFGDLPAEVFQARPLHAVIEAEHNRAFQTLPLQPPPTTSSNGFTLAQGFVMIESRLLFPRTY